jgi:peptidyl-prolyl cis-trans isomerase SurA
MFMVACSSKAKKEQELNQKLAKWEKEHQAQRPGGAGEPSRPGRLPGQREEGIVARVNDEVIFFSDVETAGKELFKKIRTEAPPQEVERHLAEARQMVLKTLVDKMLLEQEAKKRRIRVSDEEVEETIGGILKQRNMTKEQFYVELARDKVSPERLKESLRRELMVHRMLDYDIRSRIQVTDKQLEEASAPGPEAPPEPVVEPPRGGGGGDVRIQQIVLVTRGAPAAERETKRQQIQEILARIQKGEDFGKMARQYSQGPNAEGGGDSGFFKEGELLEELDRVAFRLGVGEVSPVIETSVGYHIIKVLQRGSSSAPVASAAPVARRPPQPAGGESREQIKARIEQSMFQREVMSLLESLKKTAYIDIRL